MNYHQGRPRVTECHSCGATGPCSIFVGEMERETGYIDEVAFCADCETPEAMGRLYDDLLFYRNALAEMLSPKGGHLE